MDPGLAVDEGLATSVATDVGRVRSINQDRALVSRVRLGGKWHAVGLVADGMGGGARGEEASRIAAEAFVDVLAGAPSMDTRDVLTGGVVAAHRAVLEAAQVLGLAGATFGTTLVGALVEEHTGRATIVNVGDSRAYVVSGARANPVTRDHTIVAERLAAGRISVQEALEASDRGVLTRAVGAPGRLHVDVFGPQALDPGDVLLLCSDGLHGMIDDGRIGRVVASCPTAAMAAALVDAANDQGGEDNISAVVLAVHGVPPGTGVLGRLRDRLRRRSPGDGWPMVTRVADRSGGPGNQRSERADD